MINKVRGAFSVLAIVGMLLMIAPNVYAQSVASQKAYFGSGTTEILAPDGDIILTGHIKTSDVSDLLIGVSLECALWTMTSNTATKGGGKSESSSRAAVNITVYVDGNAVENEAVPGQVVYCDRKQTVNLTFASDTEVVTDQIILDIFLETKNANHFNFYKQDVQNGVHTIEVYADSIAEKDGQPVVMDPNIRAAIGKRTLVIEEYNNP